MPPFCRGLQRSFRDDVAGAVCGVTPCRPHPHILPNSPKLFAVFIAAHISHSEASFSALTLRHVGPPRVNGGTECGSAFKMPAAVATAPCAGAGHVLRRAGGGLAQLHHGKHALCARVTVCLCLHGVFHAMECGGGSPLHRCEGCNFNSHSIRPRDKPPGTVVVRRRRFVSSEHGRRPRRGASHPGNLATAQSQQHAHHHDDGVRQHRGAGCQRTRGHCAGGRFPWPGKEGVAAHVVRVDGTC